MLNDINQELIEWTGLGWKPSEIIDKQLELDNNEYSREELEIALMNMNYSLDSEYPNYSLDSEYSIYSLDSEYPI